VGKNKRHEVLRNRQSGKYYVYAKADGKQKSRMLKTEVFSAAKPALTKLEKTVGASTAQQEPKARPDHPPAAVLTEGTSRTRSSQINCMIPIVIRGALPLGRGCNGIPQQR
jgi:hypothetical protein